MDEQEICINVQGWKMNLFISPDKIGTQTGGGLVCFHESEALKELGDGLSLLDQQDPTPFKGDDDLARHLWSIEPPIEHAVAHFYSGSFSKSVKLLKERGWKVTYTCAAHDKDVSREEHEKLGLAFPYPHLTDPVLWERYSECYRIADVLICPSQAAANICRRYGCDNRIEVIPHGCHEFVLEGKSTPFPETFCVGYLGAVGPDKGLRYLLEAWKMLAYRDSLLVLAGSGSMSPFMIEGLQRRFAGGNINFIGWVDDVSDFYDSISLYVQPSATEGFGIEVIEAMAHGRPVVASDGAGAADCVEPGVTGMVAHARDANDLAKCIKYYHDNPDILRGTGKLARKKAAEYTWDKVRARYVSLWKGLLA